MNIKISNLPVLLLTLSTLLVLSPLECTVFAASQIENAAAAEGPPVVKQPDQTDKAESDNNQQISDTDSKKALIPAGKAKTKSNRTKFNKYGMKGLSETEEGGLLSSTQSTQPFSSSEEAGLSPQTESIVGFGPDQALQPLSKQKEQFKGMGESDSEDPGSEEETTEEGEAPLTTDELLALEAAKTINGDSAEREHVIASINKAIVKWTNFAAKGGSGAGVLKRLEELKQRILSGVVNDNNTDDSDDEEKPGGNSNSAVNDNNSNGENGAGSNGDTNNPPVNTDGTNVDGDSNDSGADGTTGDGNSGKGGADGTTGDGNSGEGGTDGTTVDGDSDADSDADGTDGTTGDDDSDTGQTGNTTDNGRDNLAPDCSFAVEITKNGTKNGTVALNSFNYFDRADPRTNIASGAKKIRLSNDGISWTEFPADPNLLNRVNWKYGPLDASGNTTIFMQACDNEGNWGNGTSETFKRTITIKD
jgi:hypothetical protein